MKKTFLARRNKLLSSTNISWGVWALLCVSVFFILRLLAPNFLLHIFAPLYHATDTVASVSNTFISGFGNIAVLSKKNEQLTEENIALTNENNALIQKEKTLMALINSPVESGKSVSGILAGIVARPPESPYDTLILSVGSNTGVTLGQEAFGPGGVPLGIVSSVLPDFSRVTLFSAPGVVTNGWVGDNTLQLILQGVGAGAFSATVSRTAGINLGDIVFIPGPGALPVGSVTRIDSDESAPSVTLRITPALNIFSITWVILRDTGTAL